MKNKNFIKNVLFFIILLIGICLANEIKKIDGHLNEKLFGRWFNIEKLGKEDRVDFLSDGQFYYSHGNFVAPGLWRTFGEDSLYYRFYFNQFVEDSEGNKELQLMLAEYIGSYKVGGNMLNIKVMNLHTKNVSSYYYKTKERFRFYGHY